MRQVIVLHVFVFLLFKIAFGQSLSFEPALPPGMVPQIPLALLQDQQGFIWIGTTDGVFRYDGTQVREFRFDATDTTSISNNYVKVLTEDKSGNIWVGTKYGLNKFDPNTETFTRFFSSLTENQSGENYIHDIMEDHRGRIWYGSYEGLFQLEPASGSLQHFTPGVEQKQTLSNKLVWSIFEDQQHRIWVGTHGGFTLFKNDDQYRFRAFLEHEQQANGLNTDRIFDIVQQPNGTIWLASYNGIFRVDEQGDALKFQQFKQEQNNPNNLSDNIVYQIIPDGNEKLWISTYRGGLNEMILPSSFRDSIQFVHHRHDPNNPQSIGLDRIESILMDRSGLLWIGTANRLEKSSKIQSKFKTLAAKPSNPNSLSHDIIKSINKDSHGNLWVGTYNGLNFLPAELLKKNQFNFEIFKHDPKNPHSISFDNIEGIHEDSQGYLWISTHNGLNYCHLPTFQNDRKFHRIGKDRGLPHTFNHNLREISPGQYWLTCNGGLSRMHFDPKNPGDLRFETFKMEESNPKTIVNTHTIDVIKDRFGDYWIGTFDGISKLVRTGQEIFFENYQHEMDNSKSLSNNSFRCFFKDSKKRLWIGTRSGLNLVQQDSKNQRAVFDIFGIKDGLPNDVIHSIEEDNKGFLWISTNKGIAVFDPEQLENPVQKIYQAADGLASSSFVFRASHKDDLGNLYFGTANGLNYFHPEKLPTNTYVPSVRFTSLKVLNEDIRPKPGEGSILKKAITKTEQITLHHWQNIISLEFTALDYNNPGQNQYQYQLSSLNEDWVQLGNENSVTFTNLAPGLHTLLVKGSNNDGIWNNQPSKLIIRVLPPWWKTWWAYGIYSVLILGSMYVFFQFRIQQKVNKVKRLAALEKARQEERELLRKKNAADFHDELGHRLTKISLFLELAERQEGLSSNLKTYLGKIKKNAAGLSEGMRDLIWSLDPSKDSMYQTLVRLQEFGDQLFEFSTTHFKTSSLDQSLNQLELSPEVRKNILLIFKEAMNNCLKYAEAKNAVLEAKVTENIFRISFQDDGIGFAPNLVKNGYGLKNMKNRAAKINSELILNSKNDFGTQITLKILIE